MTKQQREIIITVGLVFILIIALSTSFKRMKKKKPSGKEVTREEVSQPSPSPSSPPLEGGENRGGGELPLREEVQKIQLARWQQSWKRDPFLLPAEEKRKSILREEVASFSLSGIVWKEGTPLALIDDYIVREGDTIEGYTVAKIAQDKVILEEAGKKYELFLEK